MKKFYDTSSLLLEENFDEKIIISSITLFELEEIKTSSRKDEDTKLAARRLLHALDSKAIDHEVIIYNSHMLRAIESMGVDINNDVKILATAINYCRSYADNKMLFYTNDLALKTIAAIFFGADCVRSVEVKPDNYCGYIELTLSEDELASLYENLQENTYNLHTNQYLIVRDKENNIIDKLCWTGEKLRPVKYYNFTSQQFGEVKPKSGDIYQVLLMDSLANNPITLVKGPAGSGKTYVSLAYLFHLLYKHKIDKIVIFCNTVATKGSAKLGYYPGSRDEKLLDSQIGNLLASKLGDKMFVEKLINDGKLVLLPMSDCRGYDTSGMNAGVYITEAQNMDINLMKLALQRIGEDSVCIIDGDPLTQVDDVSFAGTNNGMRRVSKIFRGTEVYGEVELKNIHRSRIANIAEKL